MKINILKDTLGTKPTYILQISHSDNIKDDSSDITDYVEKLIEDEVNRRLTEKLETYCRDLRNAEYNASNYRAVIFNIKEILEKEGF